MLKLNFEKADGLGTRLSFNLIYNLEAVAALLKKFMGLALVHFQKYWLLSARLRYIFLIKKILPGKHQLCLSE